MSKNSKKSTKKKQPKKAAKKQPVVVEARETYSPNRITVEAGLLCNVHTVKKAIIDFMDKKNLKFYETDPETGEQVAKRAKIAGAHVAAAAFFQQLYTSLIVNSKKFYTNKGDGLKTINKDSLMKLIMIDSAFKDFYFWAEPYDDDLQYKMPVDDSDINNLINNIDARINVEGDAKAFLSYLVTKAFGAVIKTAFRMLQFAQKRTLNPRAIIYAVTDKFRGNLGKELTDEIIRASRGAGKWKEAATEDDEEEGAEEVVEQPKKDAKKKTKKKKVEEEEEEDEEEDESEEDEEDEEEEEPEEEEEDEEEEEPEEVVKPRKKASKRRKTRKA